MNIFLKIQNFAGKFLMLNLSENTIRNTNAAVMKALRIASGQVWARLYVRGTKLTL